MYECYKMLPQKYNKTIAFIIHYGKLREITYCILKMKIIHFYRTDPPSGHEVNS